MLLQGDADLLARTPGAVVAVADDDTVLFANHEALRLLKWDDSLVGLPLTTIVPERLRQRHLRGFERYVRSGVSRLQGKTVRVPAMRQDGKEVEIDLTIRVFRRPDGSKFAVAALSEVPTGKPPPGIKLIEDAFTRRLYQLV